MFNLWVIMCLVWIGNGQTHTNISGVKISQATSAAARCCGLTFHPSVVVSPFTSYSLTLYLSIALMLRHGDLYKFHRVFRSAYRLAYVSVCEREKLSSPLHRASGRSVHAYYVCVMWYSRCMTHSMGGCLTLQMSRLDVWVLLLETQFEIRSGFVWLWDV